MIKPTKYQRWWMEKMFQAENRSGKGGELLHDLLKHSTPRSCCFFWNEETVRCPSVEAALGSGLVFKWYPEGTINIEVFMLTIAGRNALET